MAFVITDGILEKYIPEDGQTKIVIPKDVTVIGVGVFENCTQIIDVELCEGIVEIQKNAFRYTGIEKVKIPDSLISIGEDAFVCRKKGTYDWENNDGYTELKLSKKHKVYHTDGKSLLKRNDDGTDTLIFCFKKGLTAYEVPASVSVINSNAFCYCTKLWNVVLPESLVTLHDDAFLNTKVAKLELSASVAYLGNNPHRWYGRRELVQVVVDENNPRFFIENDCLYERNSDKSFTLIRCENPKNKTVSIVEGTSAIGNSAFKDSDVETVNIPDSVCVIGDEAFAHCNKLKEIAIPAGTKTIGKCAFAGCSKLKKITLPASLENVADTIADNKCNIQLADGCTKLKMIDGIIYDADITTVKLVTNGALKKASVTLPDTVTIIGSAFAEKELQHLVLGSGIEEIPNGAFRLASITTIELSSDIKKIDANAFTSLADLSFGDDSNNHFIKLIVSAGSCAEQHVRKLIMDGKSLVAIGYKEDAHNKDLQDWSYTVEESEATILKYLGNDENITIPTTIQNRPVTVIGVEAFAGKRNAVSINIPSTIKTIGQAAFALCWNIACLELPEELETIGAGAFIYCKGLKNIVIPEKVAEIAAETFYGCDLLTAITLPKTISHIDNRWLSSDADDSWKKPEFRVWKETRTGTPLKVFAEKGSYTEAFLTEYVNTYQKSGEIVSYLTVVSVTASENTECQNAEVLPVTKELLDAYFDYKEVEDDDVKFYGAIPGTMKITAIKSPDENGVVAIPEKIDGKDVTFYGAVSYFGTPIKKLTIPKTMVAQISAEYFPEIQEELVIDLENPVWSTDGVSLLSKDGANLLRMCQKDRQTYTIPDGVVTICHYAFKWNRIAELTIPDTVTTVESGAFSYCDTLVTVNGGRNIVNYTSSSFGNTPWYTKTPCLVLGKTLLRWDTEESDVILPEGIEIIGENAFGAMCSKAMETVTLPSTLKEIGKSVFARKEKLRKICLPEGLTFIGERAFSGSKELAEIIIPKSVQEIGKEAFANCSNLKSICISHSVSGYKSGALFAATLTENTLSAGCFKGCSSLESFTIPEGTIAIGEEAFSGCSLLKEVLIPDSVVTIEREAFCSCLELEKLVLSKSVAELGVGVFPHGTTGWGAKPAKFCQIVVDAENESYSSIDGVLFSKDRRTLVACPSQLSASEYSVPEGVVEIALAAFEGCNNIRKIIVSSTVTTIGERAFAAMESLEEIIFPASLEYLEKNLLIACKSLKTIVWPLNLRVIGDKCFYGAGIDTLEIPATVETIGAYAFAGIKAKSVTLPKTVKVIGLSVFAGVPEIHVYDTIDSEAKPAEVSTDDMNGACNGRVGFIGITQKESYLVAACNAVWHEHTIVVHFASDDAIKYTVRMPDGQKRKVYCTYASSWGKDATFHFGAVDAIFKDLTADAKLDYALERLFYQEGITDEMLDTLGRYVSRNAKEITEKIVASDAVEQLRLLEPYGLIKVNAFAQRLDQADRAGAVQCKAWLLEWKHAADEKKKK